MDDLTLINQLILNYFQAIYCGDLVLLNKVFLPSAKLYSVINDNLNTKDFKEYYEVVKTRKSPKQLGQEFSMKCLSIEVISNMALVKTSCPMFEFNYVDLLTLIKVKDNWSIASKTFVSVL